MKIVKSWSKPNLKNLIGRKQIDWSIFINGTTIPKEFYEDFAEANGSQPLEVGESVPLKLIYEGKLYEVKLVNVRRPEGKEKGSLQIRYDKNDELKELLKREFATSHGYLLQERDGKKSKKPIITPKELSEFIDFFKTGDPYIYKMAFRTKHENEGKPTFWWVNMGKAYKQQRDGEFLWAPQKTKQGRAVSYHVRLLEAKAGDIVFCYSEKTIRSIGIVKEKAEVAPRPSEVASNEWEEKGYLVELSYFELNPFIGKDEIPKDWRIKEQGPFDVNGNLNMGFFYALSDEFAMNLYQLFEDRFDIQVGRKIKEYKSVFFGNEKIEEKEKVSMTGREVIDHIHSYIKSKGFYYEKEEVINFFLSLKTKPFVILSGISGTGKTMIVRWFAEAIGATEANGQFTIIPVRPDWSDGSDLLGYTDIKGDFKEGPLTKVIKTASDHPEKPYIVLLDEMNLARVEYYFSDILSVMESRSFNEEGDIVTSVVLTEEIAGKNFYLPANLYIVGTVNMDETTHPFSKKVLDRANTIEFNRVQLNYLDFLQELEEVEPIAIQQEVLESKYVHLKDLYKDNPDVVHKVTRELEVVNKILEKIQAHVGYRVRDEICMYIAYSEEGQVMDFNQAMDHCLLQKILPRISGSDSRVKDVLDELIKLCAFEISEDVDNVDLTYAKYPKSAEKLIEMRRRLVDGFTSFWIS
ncbi:McrB family protein [Paucisalibacillus sp. EB02]|uniref:McrB family protein n=1 Tax=Paucisalibacillus sp. EB02 TaxID=1347087 RepID=UPI0005A98349|nr:AAA family ATPase [Paucisalibacillus sp. EB02]